MLRQRALSRLTKQATILSADAVIGIAAERALEREVEDGIGEARSAFLGLRFRSIGGNASGLLVF